jgi:hypothetical protein
MPWMNIPDIDIKKKVASHQVQKSRHEDPTSPYLVIPSPIRPILKKAQSIMVTDQDNLNFEQWLD